MIQKEKENVSKSTDRRIAAGEKAEKQMAHYLKRAFGNEEWVWVFNDLRFPYEENDAVQIDHLILYKYGIILIESKSVTTAVRIDEYERWERKGKPWKGMASPIKQVERQAEGLRSLLHAQAEALLGKILFGLRQKGFRHFPLAKLVAISDEGIISGSGRAKVQDHVHKADQVCDAVKAIMEQRKYEESIVGTALSKVPAEVGSLSNEEMIHIGNFLLENHTPNQVMRQRPQVDEAEGQPEETATTDTNTCPRCGSALILRTAKRGANVGNEFWGCSTYPKCRFTKNPD